MTRDWIFLCFLLVTVNTSTAQFAVRSFDQEIFSSSILTANCNGSSNENEFQKLIFKNGNVYVGATNTILQYSRNLELINQFDNGPGNDSISCGGPPYCDLGDVCQDTLRCANNYNRLLLPYRNQLLACGSLHAVCDLLDLSNISRTVGSSRNLKCRDQNLARQLVSAGSRNLELSLVAAIRENLEYPNRDLIYLGRPDHFIEILYAPSLQYSYFTVVDQFVESVYNKVAVYHLAWTTEDYGYVLWTNSTTEETKLSRYCNNIMSEFSRSRFREELNYPDNIGDRTYTEISLQCRGTNLQPLSTVIAAKFIYNELFILYQDGSDAVICASNVTYLNAQFDFVRDRCWNSNEGPRYARFLNSNVNCSNLGYFDAEWGSCGVPSSIAQFISVEPVLGLNPVNLFRRMTHGFSESEIATSFAISSHNGFYIVFIGTTNGSILKFRVENESFSLVEKLVSEKTYPVLDSLVIDDANENLYTITNSSLYRVRVDDCSQQYTTCDACIESRDPYCGWCVQSSKCSRRNSCPSSDEADRWIGPSQSSDRCPRVSAAEPDIISVGIPPTTIVLSFAGTALPPTLNYTCEFSAVESGVRFASSRLENLAADRSSGSCAFPTASPGLIPTTSDHVNVTLMIVSNLAVLASGQLRVYQCSKIRELNQLSMCSSCVTSEWGCKWCAGTGTCDTVPSCSNQLVNTHHECPIIAGSNFNSTTFIAAGREMVFLLRARSLPEGTNRFVCQFDFCGKTASSNAVIFSSSNYAQCRATAEMLTCAEESSAIRIILRRDNYIIDTSSLQSVTAKLYNCSASSIRDSCTRCMGFRRESNKCVWCASSSSCADISECPVGAVRSISDCEAPVIESVSPSSGPFQGGTYVKITGRNLGSRVQDIQRVRVGRINCEIVPHLYNNSRRVVCLTGEAKSNSDSGPVTVITSYQKRARSSSTFRYRNAMAWRFAPVVAINQTRVEVSGRMLNIGNSAILYFENDNGTVTTCANRQEKTMLCQLPPVEKAGRYPVVIKIDGYVSNLNFRHVQVVNNPTIKPTNGQLVAFRSAGGMASFKISSLEGVHEVTLQIGLGTEQNCTIDREQLLARCFVTPLTSTSKRKRRQSDPGENEAFVTVNGVFRTSLGEVEYRSDPMLSQLSQLPCNSPSTGSARTNVTAEQSVGPTKTIQIPGSNLNAINSPVDAYTVTLSSESDSEFFSLIPCNVTFIEANSLFCRATDADLIAFTNRRITIDVTIGELNLKMPRVQYCAEDNTSKIAIAVTLPVVVILLLVILVLLHRQRMRIKKQAKERALIMKKLDDLENKTREHARNAYYELQVGYMNNLSDNITRRITNRRPELYFIQTLFNLAGDHPVLDNADLKQETATLDAIKEWMRLIKNKDFLMTFIRTLEEQKKFTVQEKGNVASLLVVCLFSDMAYFTNIMFDLLTELIQKHIQKNPKLLLRRSESVVEKMVSHWLSITLYDECIMGSAGEPIFLLTKAIHYLVSSAPCDVIAHKSVNSLNESTLLGTEIRYSSKLLMASIQEDNGKTTKPIEVSVVDVDTISQVKQKIIDEVYKDKAYSECPKPDDYDFELLCNGSNGEGIVLSDIDPTSERKQNFTKLNTIKHYNVNDKAKVVLRPVGILKPATSPDSKTPLLNGNSNNFYHLIDDDSSSEDFIEGISNRPFQEIFLTRMVRSKTTLQEYVDGVFKTILSPDPIPLAVRYFFQFLDREAARHRITDDEVVHIWKTNSLLLRYWVNVLKNPEFIFDINKTPVVDSCLSVITQAFMDACSTSTSRKLNYDSPSNKLLYAKDAEHYQKMVNEFFLQISNTKWITDEEINQMLKRTSQQYAHKFNPRVACQGLYQYLFKYKEQIITAIRNDENEDLAKTVERVARKMERKNNQTSAL